jgi:hypothetical protein
MAAKRRISRKKRMRLKVAAALCFLVYFAAFVVKPTS